LRSGVDRVCINQSDIEERSKRVSRMLYIYKYARKVLIWLGKDHEDGDEKCRLGGNERNLGFASCTQKAFEFARRVEVVWKEKIQGLPVARGEYLSFGFEDGICLRPLLGILLLDSLPATAMVQTSLGSSGSCGVRTVQTSSAAGSLCHGQHYMQPGRRCSLSVI
jgi:hypothetical protein